jgi:hypothetical protein
MDPAADNAIFERALAPWVKELGLTVEEVSPERTVPRLPESKQLVHACGVVCGQALKTLLYGDIDIISADGKVAVHATTTYALL